MGNQLRELSAAGQSVWLDNIKRSMFASGELQKLVDIGLRGQTSNPTIFEKAIDSGTDYDAQLKGLIGAEHDPQNLFEALAIQDIRSACDVFAPVFKSTDGLDGYVSLEVSPTLAHDTKGTIAAAARLWKAVDRPNVMIKIPGTAEGIPAVRASIGAGININVTLLFSVEQYAAAATAYIDGLEDRAKAALPIDGIASVASVFVSRIDTAIDKQLDERIAKGEKLDDLKGMAGIANLKLVYQRFERLFKGQSFAGLTKRGAKLKRQLWASTSTKNPQYDDLMYVVTVVGADTVNTMPPGTIDALLDHGVVKPDTIHDDIAASKAFVELLASNGISLHDVTEQLVADGVKSFAQSFKEMLDAISAKHQALAGKEPVKAQAT